MGIRSILVALLGVAVAGGSAFATREYMHIQTANAAVDPQSTLVTVVVAGTDIPYGQPILQQSLQIIPWPRDALPAGAFTDLSLVIAPPGQPPRRAIKGMVQGDLLLASKLSAFGEKVTLVQSLGPNTRAMAIKVDAETGVGGFVTPGDTVDILLTQGKDAAMSALTILQNIRVVGVDQEADEGMDQPEIARTVTVEVSPEQGQVLALAQKAGTLALTLRSLDSLPDEPLASLKLSDILRTESPVEDKQEARPTIRVRRGSALELVEVQ